MTKILICVYLCALKCVDVNSAPHCGFFMNWSGNSNNLVLLNVYTYYSNEDQNTLLKIKV